MPAQKHPSYKPDASYKNTVMSESEIYKNSEGQPVVWFVWYNELISIFCYLYAFFLESYYPKL